MKKLLAFILWPALGGLVFAIALLQAPRLVNFMPGLAGYFPQNSQPATNAGSPLVSFSEAIRKAAPAVVSINYQQLVERTQRIMLNRIFPANLRYEDISNSLGSGVIISPDGYIITSYHVLFDPALEVLQPQFINVTLNDGRTIKADVKALDEKNDLALLKVDAANLPYLQLADTSTLQRGDVVLAIGNPRNIGQSVSFGIISALWRRNESFMIQTDAAINPGNSGGALINIEGNLIGINSTIVSESGGSEGISFAIPADLAMNMYRDILTPSGYLGVNTEVLSLQRGQQLLGQEVEGFLVNEVVPNSPADKAGIRVDDIITGVNDKKLVIRSEVDMSAAFAAIGAISNLEPGAFITVEVFREGKFIKLPTVLGAGAALLSIEEPDGALDPGSDDGENSTDTVPP